MGFPVGPAEARERRLTDLDPASVSQTTAIPSVFDISVSLLFCFTTKERASMGIRVVRLYRSSTLNPSQHIPSQLVPAPPLY